MKTAYLDNAATTRLDPRVREAMEPAFGPLFGNPSSLHAAGRAARKAIEDARERIAARLGCDPKEILFTSCATESNNLALHGRTGVAVSAVEHPSVIEAARGATILPVDETGRIREIPSAPFVSVMLANNEVGTIQPIAEIAKAKRGLLHVDAAQALGKIPVSLDGIDLLTFSGHKIHGPKGIGGLFVRKGTPLTPMLMGGGQEFEKRAGTENVALILGLARSVELCDPRNLEALRARLWKGLSQLPDVHLNGHPTERLPSILNVSFDGVDGEAAILALDAEGVQVSTGSACASLSMEVSPVLRAMGLTPERARASIRFSVSWDTREEEIDLALEKVPKVIGRLRAISANYGR